MRNQLFLVALTAAALSAFGMFHIKYTVRDLEKRLAATERSISEEEKLMRTRKADLALLTRPQRLADNAAALGLKPAQGTRVVAADQIGYRSWVDLSSQTFAITLPAGGEGSLSIKPMTTFQLQGLDGP